MRKLSAAIVSVMFHVKQTPYETFEKWLRRGLKSFSHKIL
jgi:hypothetical protein